MSLHVSDQKQKIRADQLLVEQGLAENRSRAQALIMAGEVFAGELKVEKAGQTLSTDLVLRIRNLQKYVSRGGIKLEGALSDSGFDPTGLVAADIGASTGGFTDCLLQHGAARVFAIDVGHGQLAGRLRNDPRVVVMERTNARTLTAEQVGGGVDLVVVDASFIGLGKLLPALAACLIPGGHLLALIKPQFEVGREEATRHAGVIRDPILRQKAVDKVCAEVETSGFSLLSNHRCRLPGPKGNVEHFILAQREIGESKG